MEVREIPGPLFEVFIETKYDPSATLDLAELIVLKATVTQAIDDYMARSVSKLVFDAEHRN
jgi:hypothetical protein